MSVKFEFEGLEELRAQLRNLPRELTAEASRIIDTHGALAESEIRANYEAHRFTGNLADRVERMVRDAGAWGYELTVRARAPHAKLFEYGTAARHTSQGVARGVMPPAPPMHRFVPVMQRHRRQMWDELARMLEAHGLEVTGDAG